MAVGKGKRMPELRDLESWVQVYDAIGPEVVKLRHVDPKHPWGDDVDDLSRCGVDLNRVV